MRCLPCRMTFTRWRWFSRHALHTHGIARARLRDTVRQHPGDDYWIVRHSSGRLMLMVQAPLL